MRGSDCIRVFHHKPPHSKFGVHFTGLRREAEPAAAPDAETAHSPSLLAFRDWWERREAIISAGGERICGIPAFIEHGAMRVICETCSYFIPLEKIDYIRTEDGFCPSPRPLRFPLASTHSSRTVPGSSE